MTARSRVLHESCTSSAVKNTAGSPVSVFAGGWTGIGTSGGWIDLSRTCANVRGAPAGGGAVHALVLGAVAGACRDAEMAPGFGGAAGGDGGGRAPPTVAMEENQKRERVWAGNLRREKPKSGR